MNILLIGGSGSFINNLIIKLNKEGHRLYLLTGSRYKQAPYQKVFERYDFTYDCSCLDEIFESVDPDVVLYMGAFDTNYRWVEEEREAVRYSTNLMNILMAYAKNCSGQFIYLSSHEVYSLNYPDNIEEDEPLTPSGFRSMVLAQGEEICESHRGYRSKDIITLRLDHLYSIPNERKDVDNICSKMCLEVLEDQTITLTEGNSFTLLYETDAVEFIYRIIKARRHKYPVYNIATTQVMSEFDIASLITDYMGFDVDLKSTHVEGTRKVLSSERYVEEFGKPFACEVRQIISKMVSYMKKNRYIFLTGAPANQPFWKRLFDKSNWFVKALIPFLENLLCFVVFFILHVILMNSTVFAGMDFFLLYVLIFAIVYGQQQATFSAVLSVIGYFYAQTGQRSGFDIMMDTHTYVWMAELFILGLSVGYMRDQLKAIKNENVEEREFLSEQLSDIQDINSSNVRVKDALSTQIINQNDSVGKIFSITSALEQYSPEEVLFFAAEILAKLMKSKDVAIYTVSNNDYARLFSYTSSKAKVMGNSIKYRELGEVYETLMERKVYINRKMDEQYPLMASAIMDNDEIQMMIFIWGIQWEQMTLGQANQLTVISALIQNALLRANRYLAALEKQRFVEDSRMLNTEAFTTLARAYVQVEIKHLTECTLLRVFASPSQYVEIGKVFASNLRPMDYVGTLPDGYMYALLSNTTAEEAQYVIRRFEERGYRTEIMEDEIAWQSN